MKAGQDTEDTKRGILALRLKQWLMRKHEESKDIQEGPNFLSTIKESLNLCWNR